jgi:uncharacterized protein (TIGR02145 family)
MKRTSLIFATTVLATILISSNSCTSEDDSTPKDDSNKQTCKIGNQVWMSENLNVDKFRNGDPIPEARTAEEWKKANDNKQPAWCYYNNDPNIGAKYGKMYNWYTVVDPRGLAPAGYHIPTDEEWTILAIYLGGETVAGEKLKSTSGWKDLGNGTGQTCFSALPNPMRGFNGQFGTNQGEEGVWWSFSTYNNLMAYTRRIVNTQTNLFKWEWYKGSGFSVRCIKD